MTDAELAGGRSSGGSGRLAQVIATRGGTAAPEAPFVIEHREALIYMLCEAAELEHGIMCQYLFAAFSLKQSTDEGLTEAQLAAANRWRKQVLHVAAQEMLHLALVQNLLTAIGGPPHLVRPNLPQPAEHYPAGVQLALLPFGEQALSHFMFLERPEGMDLSDARGLAAVGRAEPLMSEGDIVPRPQDFSTVGHLYRSIEAGFAHLTEKYGQDWLFVGPPRAQACADHFRWPELVTVTDQASAQRAIDTILEQGEGPRGEWRNAHFGQFVNILDEFQQMREANPGFDPVRPVIAANVRPPQREVEVPLITDPQTARVADLFNVGYEILLQAFYRYFAHTEETDAQLKTLADATVSLMVSVLQPLANVITTLPAGPGHEGKTAGPSFELFYESDYLLPHREAAWTLLTERLDAAAAFCVALGGDCTTAVAERLAPVIGTLRELADSLAAHLPAGRSRARSAGLDQATLGAQLARAADLARRAREADDSDGMASELAGLADAVQRAAQESAPGDLVWEVAQAATRIRAGQAGAAAPELAEATAVLQSLACELGTARERAERRDELWHLQGNLPAGIQTARNGPYLATNVRAVRNYLGEQIPLPPQVAFCRCGGSATKPFCDGACASNGFTEAKDPKRVPDRLDTYNGVQVTILDNRGTCQHSGLCTDRLPTAFRVGQEPFVAPSGARADEIVAAVRDCPSGALSLAIDGRAARAQTDWGDAREPAIEVTKDGPYRVTGGIRLTDAAGADVHRNEGASREHYAVCRCGHSQNKPFCSGMHWYVDFRDPAPDADPTVFEWAGGLPALTRMTRLFFEKHVPGDPVLAPLFANIPPGLPQKMAAWLGEVFGGPASQGDQGDGYPQILAGLLSEGLDDEQRGRWVTLLGQAAQEARLPTEPEFRAALTSFIEWDPLISNPQGGAGGARGEGREQTVPSWDWGPAGPPAVKAAETADDADQPVALPEPGQPVSFAAHVKPLFRKRDRDSMSFALDLWSYEDVKAHAADILERLGNGSMPCDGAWPKDQVEVFARWTATQMRP
ncbi:MAG TPA: ferritin-like domain-containing protein [Streptosporangiaceae bacterium]|nr:ferritin-like domain-containing protein [Streptosporangiaceae bacterium]